MELLSYFECFDQERLLSKIAAADWGAAGFLAKLLREGTFLETLGGEGGLYLLMEGDEILSFATLTRQDCIRDDAMAPWIGFVYTYPQHRGHRCSGILIAGLEQLAARQGHKQVYIATDHVGLYEKYGYEYLENRIDCWGEDCRILYKKL